MGLLSNLTSLFAAKTAPAATARSGECAIIDGNALAGGRGRVRPSDQFALLKRLADFSAREGIALTVVFEGRPLREVEDGRTYRNLQVLFVEDAAGLPAAISDAVRKAGRGGAIVVSDNRDICAAADRDGAGVMNPATLRKAIEGPGGRQRPDGRAPGGRRGGERGGERGERGGDRGGDRRGGQRPSRPEADAEATGDGDESERPQQEEMDLDDRAEGAEGEDTPDREEAGDSQEKPERSERGGRSERRPRGGNQGGQSGPAGEDRDRILELMDPL